MKQLLMKLMILVMPFTIVYSFEFSKDYTNEEIYTENCAQYDSKKFMILDFTELDAESYQDFCDAKYKKMLIRINEEDEFPLSLYLSGDVFTMNKSPETHKLTCLKEFYVRCNKKNIFRFSFDRKKWYNWNKFFKGSISVGVFPSESLEKIVGEVNSELNFAR